MLLSHNKWMQREKLFYSPVVVLSEMHTNRGTSALNNYEKVSFRDLYKELHNMALQYIIWDNFKNGLGGEKKTLCSRKSWNSSYYQTLHLRQASTEASFASCLSVRATLLSFQANELHVQQNLNQARLWSNSIVSTFSSNNQPDQTCMDYM